MMDSPLGDGAKDGASEISKDSKAVDERASSHNGSASAEVLRLQNNLRVKDRELEDARKEVMTLRASLSFKDRALSQSDQELRIHRERNTAMEGELASMAKELATTKVDKRKLETQIAGLAKRGDKEQSLVSLLAHERATGLVAVNSVEALSAFNSVASADHVAALQADLRVAKHDTEKAAESVKVLENVLRSKDKQIHTLKHKLEEVEVYKAKCIELENRLSELHRQLDGEKQAGRTSADVVRSRDSDRTRLMADLAKARTAMEGAQEAAARTSATLKVSEARCVALEQEVGILVGQLARTSAVAQRVAASEVKTGCKNEGYIHVTRHIEEVRFMSGEIVRLQDRIASLEKQLAVSDELKDQYRRQSESGNSPRGSPCASPSGAATAAAIIGRTYLRPGSRVAARPLSAPRRPATASATSPAAAVASSLSSIVRPSSAPRARAAGVRASTNSTPATIAAAAAAAAAGGSESPRARAGSAAASGGAIRNTFSSSNRRMQPQQQQQKKLMPWNSNAKSPAKLAAAAAAGLSPGASGALASSASGKVASPSTTPRSSITKARASALAAALQVPAAGGEAPAGEAAAAAVETAVVETPVEAEAAAADTLVAAKAAETVPAVDVSGAAAAAGAMEPVASLDQEAGCGLNISALIRSALPKKQTRESP